jgi:hypothetical protein
VTHTLDSPLKAAAQVSGVRKQIDQTFGKLQPALWKGKTVTSLWVRGQHAASSSSDTLLYSSLLTTTLFAFISLFVKCSRATSPWLPCLAAPCSLGRAHHRLTHRRVRQDRHGYQLGDAHDIWMVRLLFQACSRLVQTVAGGPCILRLKVQVADPGATLFATEASVFVRPPFPRSFALLQA